MLYNSVARTYSNFCSCAWPHRRSLDIMPLIQPPGRKVSYQQIRGTDITDTLSEEQEIQIFAKQMLINRLFLGHYQERRFVESLDSYRDVVVVISSEFELKKDLEIVKNRLKNFGKFSKIWVGITGPELIGAPAGHAVWVKLQNLPFGHYWFQIKQVKFVDKREMILRLKCIRSVDVGSVNLKESGESENVSEVSQENAESSATSSDVVDWSKVKGRWKGTAVEMMTNFRSVLTVRNVKEVICFASILVAACVTGVFHSVKYLGDFSIRFMREFSIFIQAATPIFLAIIDFFAKCVGGFYLLIAMLWKGSTVQQPPYGNWKPPPRALPMGPNM